MNACDAAEKHRTSPCKAGFPGPHALSLPPNWQTFRPSVPKGAPGARGAFAKGPPTAADRGPTAKPVPQQRGPDFDEKARENKVAPGARWDMTTGGTPHTFTLRVYYEDTDLAGIVYYANYLKFIERARSEWVRAVGVDQVRLKAEQGVVFAVRRVEADYLRPAHFDDQLTVTTALIQLGGARIELEQKVLRGVEPVFQARVTLVCLAGAGAVRIPAAVRAALAV